LRAEAIGIPRDVREQSIFHRVLCLFVIGDIDQLSAGRRAFARRNSSEVISEVINKRRMAQR
jgi:hypothetical protein